MAEKKITSAVEKAPVKEDWKIKECRVINYIKSHGILGFDFNGVGCQIMIAPFTKIGHTVKIKYLGDIENGVKFKF